MARLLRSVSYEVITADGPGGLDKLAHESFDAVVEYAQAHHTNNRIAAYMLALDRVADAIKLRGIYA